MAQPQTVHHCDGTVLFEDKQWDFRIPALVYIKEWKTFLAFAERRKTSKDETAKNLVMRRGTPQPDGTLQWSAMEDLKKATKCCYRSMSPCPVFERSTGTLFLFFICIKGKITETELKPGQTCLCYVTTKDGGKSWSKLKDVTKNIYGINLSQYKTFAVGPGHGIEAERGQSDTVSKDNRETRKCSRLLIPAYVVIDKEISHALVLYSDNAGKTWHAGKQLFKDSGECQVAEVRVTEGTDLYIYCSARNLSSEAGKRLEALSDDTGESFTKLQSLSLNETPHGCQGSVLGFPAKDSSNTWLLFSHPTSGPKDGDDTKWVRRDLGVCLRKSLQDGWHVDDKPWGEPKLIHPGKSGYSDLAQCEGEDRFACLMECGESVRSQIVFKEISLNIFLT